MDIKSAQFVISNTDVEKCPNGSLPEYAFIGRSNVGKSSLINSICNKKNLAKTSSRPGKTQLINHFLINLDWHLVDLPGYGYARASKSQKKVFQAFITNYFEQRIWLREKLQKKHNTILATWDVLYARYSTISRLDVSCGQQRPTELIV